MAPHTIDPPRELSAFRRRIPTSLHFGWGEFSQAGRLCRPLGRRALIVTKSRTLDRQGAIQELRAGLEAAHVEVLEFSEFSAGPTTDQVDAGAALCRDFRADFLVALGGGSAIDCAKAIAAVAPTRSTAADFLYGRATPGAETLPTVAMPTTSGTGSELNRSAIITDPQQRYKDGIRSDRLIPRIAIVDPALTCSLPPDRTAETGFDCLAHAVESYVSPKASGQTDRLAVHAIHAVCRWLPIAMEDPQNRPARESLAAASTTMGINLTCVGTCFPHRADKALCGLHPEIPHGRSVAMFYPAWISHSHSGNVARFAEIARILQPDVASESLDKQAEALPAIVRDLLERLGMPSALTHAGVVESELPDLVERTAGDLSVNPVPLTREELPGLYLRAFRDPLEFSI